MNLKYTMVPSLKEQAELAMHPDVALKLGIQVFHNVNLRYGVRSSVIIVRLDDSLELMNISLSKKIIDVLGIPLFPQYEILYSEQGLVLGPYIGILAESSSKLLAQRIARLTGYIRHYEAIGGAIIAFSPDQVDTKKQTIRGYMFNPQTKRWESGLYGYPASIFSKAEASLTHNWGIFQSLLAHFQAVIGNRIFNYPIFDKWEMHTWLIANSKLRKHVPATVLYQQPQDITRMLKRRRSVYIKPLLGRLAIGLMEASIQENGIRVQYRYKGDNNVLTFENKAEAEVFFQKTVNSKEYIVQETIDLLSVDDRIIDFRVILVKNPNGQWQDMGLFSRYGASGSIVSNITSGGKTDKGEATLQVVLSLTDQEVLKIKEQIMKLALQAAAQVDKYITNLGNLGIDIAVDKEKRIWIIEMNNQNPDHYIAFVAGDKRAYFQARLTNILYAKSLAGFE